nr:PBP1A family penicillin-binding protein [Actinomycetota bacterium]
GRPPAGRKPLRGKGTSRPRKGGNTRPKWQSTALKIVGIVTLMSIIGGGLVGMVIWKKANADLPDITGTARGTDQTSYIYDRNGTQLARLYADENRTHVAISDIPIAVRQGVIATEDQNYYEHKGIDPWGIARALWVDITQGKRHGGSTITQQYVVNAFVERENSLMRKLKEGILAYRLEQDFSKDEILEKYLNTIYYGHGAYGVEAASKTYFGVSASGLSISQSAMIAGVIKSPGRYSPYLDPEAAVDRRDTVLGQMLSEGYITQEQHDAAVAEEMVLSTLQASATAAPYFVEYIKAQLTEEYGSETVYRGGITVSTTIDMRMQTAAENAITNILNEEGDPSAALVAIDPRTGEIMAMVGGTDFTTQQFNVAVQGRRQPGSAFKPFVLATALAEGVPAEKSYECGPAKLPLSNGQTWSVTGAHGAKTSGPMRLRQATEKSVNSIFAQLILAVSPSDVVTTIESMGIHEGIMAVPAIALGGLNEGVSPLEMASAYGTFANAGVHATPQGLLEVSSADGETMYSLEPELTEAIDPAVAYLTTDILKGAISRGTGTGANIGRPAAGKTGTTQAYRDAWFVGYTPDLVCAVWVGHPDGQIEMANVHGRKVSGGSFPADIWAQFMKEALVDTPSSDFTKPSGLVNLTVCDDTGLLNTEYCEKSVTGLFIRGFVPKETCDLHTGPIEIDIPNVIGMTKEAAIALLKQLMLLFEVTEKDVHGIPAGIVASQTPAAGSTGTTETVVSLIVANGGDADLSPIAQFVFGPTEPSMMQPVAFDGSVSTDDGEIVTYLWEFGDGTEEQLGANVSHVFSDPGTWEITLWVTDDSDQTSSVTQKITVK